MPPAWLVEQTCFHSGAVGPIGTEVNLLMPNQLTNTNKGASCTYESVANEMKLFFNKTRKCTQPYFSGEYR